MGEEGDLVLDDADLEYVVDSPPESRPPSSKAGAMGGAVVPDGLGGEMGADGAAEAGLASRPPSAPLSAADSTGKKSAGGKSSAGTKRKSAGLQQPKTPGAIQVG